MTSYRPGPNGFAVDRFLERVAALGPYDVDAAVQVWREAQRSADLAPTGRGNWSAAEDAAAEALMRTGRANEAWQLQDRIHGVFRRAPWRRTLPSGAAGVRSEATAQYLVTTATLALVLADALPARHLATLYSPFHALIPLAEIASFDPPGSLVAFPLHRDDAIRR